MAIINLLCSFFFLPFFIKALSQDDKDKVNSCLLLYRYRKYQDHIKFTNILNNLKKVIQNPEEKILLFSLADCYDKIGSKKAKDIYYNYNKDRFIDSLSKDNKNLLNLENLAELDFDQFSDKINKFTPIFNQVYKDAKGASKDYMNNNKLSDKLSTNKYMTRDTIILIVTAFLIMLLFVSYFFWKMNQIQRQYEEENKDDRSNTPYENPYNKKKN